MVENVFKDFVKVGIIKEIIIKETAPNKGKPAQRDRGATMIYVVSINLNNEEIIIDSARGGPREWASLDSLDKWLKGCGVIQYSVNHALSLVGLQQSLELK